MRYSCSVCGRPFRKSGTLARHMRIHTNERPYICEACGKSFKLLFHLRLHAAAHSPDLPFACDLCEKAFRTTMSLQKHKFTHTGLKPFFCPVCSRPFSRTNNMQAHLRAVHGAVRMPSRSSGPKHPHDCVLCRKRFSSLARLQLHLQTHAHQLELNVDAIVTSAVDSPADFGGTGAELTDCKVKKPAEDLDVTLPHIHFDD